MVNESRLPEERGSENHSLVIRAKRPIALLQCLLACHFDVLHHATSRNNRLHDDIANLQKNPEYIVKKDGKLYCTCSGWGADKRVAVIDIKSFDKASYFDVMDNPDRIIEVDGHIYVQGYGADWSYPWGELDTNTGKFTQIGNCSSWASYKNTLYLAFSETDWSTYATTTTFTSYNAKSGQLNKASFLKNAPSTLTSSSVYGMSVNEKTGDIYVLTTDFVTNGRIYHFNSDGTFVKDFASSGVNPRKIVFLD